MAMALAQPGLEQEPGEIAQEVQQTLQAAEQPGAQQPEGQDQNTFELPEGVDPEDWPLPEAINMVRLAGARNIGPDNKPVNVKLTGWCPTKSKPQQKELVVAVLERTPLSKPKNWSVEKLVKHLIENANSPIPLQELAAVPPAPPFVPVAFATTALVVATEEAPEKHRWSKARCIRMLMCICPDHRTPWARTRSHRPRTGSAGATGASCTCSRCPGDGQVLPAHAKLPVSADSDEWVISTHNAARTSIHQRARLGATTSGQCQLTGGHRIHQASANKELWVAVMGHIPTMRPKNWAVPRW